jgi:hypothetical protein
MSHPDSLSPIELLQNRKRSIDQYIERLTRNGDTGSDFKKFYEAKSNEFKRAIEALFVKDGE